MAYGKLITDVQLNTGLLLAGDVPTPAWLAAWVPPIEDAVEKFLGRSLVYEEDIVEWHGSSDDSYILLEKTPVELVSEVVHDPAGGFGQIPDTFGADRVLAAGTDYYLQLDGKGPLAGWSVSGALWRRGSTWGYARRFAQSMLHAESVPAYGTTRVTYSGGYVASDDPDLNTMPGAVTAAIVQACGVFYATMPNVGFVTGESGTGYSYNMIVGAFLGENVFATVRKMLDAVRRRRPGGGG